MTKEKITLIQNDPQKVTVSRYHRPITYLPIIRKILTALIRKEIYYSLECCGLFAREQKTCREGTRGTNYLQYIERHFLKEVKTRKKCSLGID